MNTREGQDYQAYTRATNQVKWECKKAMREYEVQIAKEAKTNHKAFYAYARNKTKTREGVADLDNAQGDTAITDEYKARVLNEFFSSLHQRKLWTNFHPLKNPNLSKP